MGLGQWLKDTAREVTSGGKAKTKTYNSSPPAPSRPAPAPIRLPGQSAPSQYVSTPTPRKVLSSSQPQQSWSGPRPAPVRSAGPSWATQQALAATKKAQAETAAAQKAQAATEKAARDAAVKASEKKRVDEYNKLSPTAQRLQLWKPESIPNTVESISDTQQRTLLGDKQVEASKLLKPARKLTAFEIEQNRLQARANDPSYGLTANTHELSDAEFAKLTPRQRAAVLFNTGLLRAKSKDENNDGSEVKDYLSAVGLEDRASDDTTLRRYTDLSGAIDDALLKGLKASDEKLQPGVVNLRNDPNRAGAPSAQARLDANTVATAIAEKLRSEGRLPGLGVKNAGFGQSKHDSVLQTAYGIMVDSSVNQTSEDIAQGLAQLNQVNGTNVTPQQLWNFTKVQLDAADYGKIADAEISVPVPDASITPLSIKDIRARYGL
jgi:hypothetical protein